MRVREGFDPSFHGGDIGIDAVRLGEPQDRLNHGEDVSCPVIDLAGEESLPLLRPFPVSDVGGNAADPDNAILVIDSRNCRADAPSDLPVWTVHAKFGLVGARVKDALRPGMCQPLPIIGIEESPDSFGGYLEVVGVHSENAAMALVPHTFATCEIPIPRSHLADSERQTSALLAFQQHGSVRL